MKKYIKIVFLIFIAFLLSSCKDKDTYNLIEISCSELINYIYNNKDANIVFAIYNSNKSNYTNYLKDLEKAAKNAKIDIYYVDYEHIDVDSSMYLFNLDGGDYTTNGYFAYVNGETVVSASYTDYITIVKDIKNLGFSHIDLPRTEEEKNKENLKKAGELYEAGDISLSYDYLNKAWPTEEAKEMYENNKYYKLLIAWESYDYSDAKSDVLVYQTLFFYHGSDFFSSFITEEDKSTFTKPTTSENFIDNYYYVKDDIIYTAKFKDLEKKPTYKIEELGKDRMSLIDLKKNKKYNFVRRT